MQFLLKFSYKTLYLMWAFMFVLTAVLGMLYPSATGNTAQTVLMVIASGYFLPPWAIMTRGQKEKQVKHVKIVRYLSIASVAATCVLLSMNILSVGMSEAVGNALQALLTIVSAPLVCSNFYVMPLFLWGMLIMATFTEV